MYKNENKSEPGKYRPVSLTCIVCIVQGNEEDWSSRITRRRTWMNAAW